MNFSAPLSTEPEQRFALPLPPSLANSFAVVPGAGRVPSSLFRRWLDDAGAALAAQRPRPLAGPVAIALELNPPNGRLFDIAARRTAVLNLLVAHHLLRGAQARALNDLPIRLVACGAPLTIIVSPR